MVYSDEILADKEGNNAVVARQLNSKKDYVNTDKDLVLFLCAVEDELSDFLDEGKIKVCSEHRRNGIMFRSHHNYRKKGPWRDWTIIHWGPPYGDLPSQIWGFFEVRKLHQGGVHRLPMHLSGGALISKGTWAIIESTEYTGNDQPDSLFRETVLEASEKEDDGSVKKRKFYLVDVESFKDPIVVIPNHGSKDKYFVMTPRSTWAELFSAWLDKPHEAIEDPV